jgi:hypothetical protein
LLSTATRVRRKEHLMNPLSSSRILRLGLACTAALVLAASADARGLPIATSDTVVARYGWGAAATVAKRQSTDLVARYGWGAAAAYAKLHG